MLAYKTDVEINRNGEIKIVLPENMRRLFNHTVEVVILGKDEALPKKKAKFHWTTFKCGGKLKDFTREDIYEDRF